MRDGAAPGRALRVTIALLLAASAALGGAAMLGWARIGFQVPLRGTVEVRVDGSQLLPALAPLAMLVLAAVAAALATGGWARWLLGTLLLVAASLPALGVVGMADQGWLTGTAVAAAGLPARSIPTGTVTVLPAGPGFALSGAALLAVAGVVLVARGRRMPRLGRRYQAPPARPPKRQDGPGRRDGPGHQAEQWWQRMGVGEDPTASGHPRDVASHRTELASRPGSARGGGRGEA